MIVLASQETWDAIAAIYKGVMDEWSREMYIKFFNNYERNNMSEKNNTSMCGYEVLSYSYAEDPGPHIMINDERFDLCESAVLWLEECIAKARYKNYCIKHPGLVKVERK